MMICGHSEGCMYRYRHKGLTYKYCMACICEKSGVGQIGENPNYKTPESKVQERKEKMKDRNEDSIKKATKEVKVKE